MYVHVTAKGAMSFRMDCQPMSWLRSTMQPSRPSRNGHPISTAFRFRSGAKDPERNTLRNAVINWPDGGRRGKEPFPRWVKIRVVLFGAEEMNFSGAAYAQAHEGEAGKIVVAGEADFGARNVYSVQLPGGAAGSDFGHTLERIIAPLGLTSIAGQPSAAGTTSVNYRKPAC